jgi:hypothetical protein
VRQLFNWRFVAAVLALAVLGLIARAVLSGDDTLEAVVEPDVIERRIDLIDPIAFAVPSEGFRVGRDGVTRGYLDLVLDAERTVRIAPGTHGEVACDDFEVPNSCAVFADMLGEAVVWFAILPQAPRATVELPPIVDLVDGFAHFENGWQIPFPAVIERDCEGEDIASFADFLRRFGPDSVSIVDLGTRQVVQVRCADPS